MTRSLRVAAVQMDCRGSAKEIEERAVRMIRRAAKLGAAVACLPEHWVPGGIPDRGRFLGTFGRVAKESGIAVIPGAEFVKEDGITSVESFLLKPDGSVGSQRKVHLFDREKKRASPGNRYSIFRVDGAKIGIAICHDLVYPEVARIFALQGAEVIFAPAKIRRGGLSPWHIYVRARALENRIPVVSPNVLGEPGFSGGSVIVGLEEGEGGIVYPLTLATAGNAPKVLVADLNLGAASKLRKQRLGARRVETFAPILQSIGPSREADSRRAV